MGQKHPESPFAFGDSGFFYTYQEKSYYTTDEYTAKISV